MQNPLRRPSGSPHQNYHSPHVGNKQHPSPYSHVGIAPNGQQPSPESYYSTGPYAPHGMPTASPQYSHMYMPQSHSPVTSHGQEQPGSMYPQASQMSQPMYYSAYHMGPLSTHPSHHMIPPPPPPPHSTQPPIHHTQQAMHAPVINNSHQPQIKYEAKVARPPEDNGLRTPAHQAPSDANVQRNAAPNTEAAGSTRPQVSGGSQPQGPSPGPIPATTPLVVKQDKDGVQWIAFEYSKDRVKMEYQIQCNVESVNTDSLSRDFKEANCVYPRAFCEKAVYTGNRYNYESECNTVGWALAELNKTLREKRGLIQRAVDSWRNSNQDSRLRSRRVRRMNKKSTRSKSQQSGTGNQRQTPSTPSSALLNQRPLPQSIDTNTSQIHHHHVTADDGGLPNHPDPITLNGSGDAIQHQHKMQPAPSPSQIRPSNVFHGYPGTYPMQSPHGAISIAPPLQNGLNPHFSHPTTTISASSTMQSMPPGTAVGGHDLLKTTPSRNLSAMYPRVLEKKFINVHDPGHNPNRVRVKLDLRDVKIDEVVDDFRERNSVYPRSYVPDQMQLTASEKRTKRLASRFTDLDANDANGFETGRTTVKVPTLDGDAEAPVPRLGKRVGEQEELMNDTGYRISWGQLQKYDRRTLFLQRSLDAWRKKMRELNAFSGLEAGDGAIHDEHRIGKQSWLAREPRFGHPRVQ